MKVGQETLEIDGYHGTLLTSRVAFELASGHKLEQQSWESFYASGYHLIHNYEASIQSDVNDTTANIDSGSVYERTIEMDWRIPTTIDIDV